MIVIVAKVSKPLIYSVPLELEYYFSKSFWPVLEILLLLLYAKLSRKTNIFFLLTLQIKDMEKKHNTCLVYFKSVGWAAHLLVGKVGSVAEGEDREFWDEPLSLHSFSFVNESQIPNSDFFFQMRIMLV